MTVDITLIHPSRGRAVQAFDAAKTWLKFASCGRSVEYLMVVDADDAELPLYRELRKVFTPWSYNKNALFSMLVRHTDSVVAATNAAAGMSSGEIMVYVSDDFVPPYGWDGELASWFLGADFPMLLKVDDCLQPFGVRVLTVPVMNRLLYNALGYFWHPEYKSMFVDCDLYEVCDQRGWLRFAPELKFVHNHCSVGKAVEDATYKRSALNWSQGEELFKRRKKMGFPVL